MGSGLRELLTIPPGPVDLAAIDTAATPGAPGGKDDTADAQAAAQDELADLQEQLFAMAEVEASRRRLLLVLQGLDASGKDGAVKRGLAGMNPKWMSVTGFGEPTEEEARRHFLWRIRREVPPPGHIGIFARSHYEDVVAARVHGLVPEDVWRARYDEINAFERGLAEDGVVLVKVFLHISHDYQRGRQLRRLRRVDKRWKFDEGDLEDRALWGENLAAYEDAIERCNTPAAPWFVVPGDNKWYRNWAVSRLVLETLRGMGLRWPPREELDLDALRARLHAD